jgi:hypothetical protein
MRNTQLPIAASESSDRLLGDRGKPMEIGLDMADYNTFRKRLLTSSQQSGKQKMYNSVIFP